MNAPSRFNTRYPFHPYSTGWFVVAFSDELAPGQVKPARYFAKDLVIFRTESGKAAVADAHCPHLGAHLGYDSKVQGETIECPFHQWRYDTKGACVSIPFTDKIPPKAKIRMWETREYNNMIYVWHDIHGGAPTWEMPEFDETGRVPGSGFHKLHDDFGGAHPQDILENAVDWAHFPGVHSTGRAVSGGEIEIVDKVRFRSPIHSLAPGYDGPPEGGQVVSDIMAEVVGPGVANVRSTTPFVPGVTAVNYVGATPVDETLTHYRVTLFLINDVNNPAPQEAIDQFDAYLTPTTKKEQYSDGKIWPHKAYVAAPILSDQDGPIFKYRKWYEQFHPAV